MTASDVSATPSVRFKLGRRREFRDNGGICKGATGTLFIDGKQVVQGQIPRRIPIRFSLDETHLLPGHWEGDLLAGSRNSHIATLVDNYH
jgi:hypothetical protein